MAHTKAVHQANQQFLTVPRRPDWNASTTPEQLDRAERDAFLAWRKGLAVLQESDDLLLTPFERNLEVWRQLWRVVERSHIVVQIVDARNPLLFRCLDLEDYVKEFKKTNLMLVNKADLLTEQQRLSWANYFQENNIKFYFFSASEANEKLEFVEQDSTDSATHLDDFAKQISLQDEYFQIYTTSGLEEAILSHSPDNFDFKDKLVVGMVGYPNVGKSSTINALVGDKKVRVSSTPGKTKHFQTIHLSDKIVLCDCPGLVFPNFAYSKAELVVNSVLPVDQLREHVGPVSLVARRIPKSVIEKFYGIHVPISSSEEGGLGYPTAEELLQAFARARGFTKAGQGNPDEARAARYILKDYVNGKLLFCHSPPGIDEDEFNKNTLTSTVRDCPDLSNNFTAPGNIVPVSHVDHEFFTDSVSRAHTKTIHSKVYRIV